ncbi:MAG TPA: PilZ domain-containing protein [Solirubrobacteraceae bacterium]|nr:PilZ domain-containing protein [Solirubrobacteraceae bacterium]
MPPERRRSPRAAVALQCTLHRRTGSAIEALTVDLGPGGMCVTCSRPLAADEVLRVDLPLPEDVRFDGRARVLRQEGFNRYALRFEQVREPALERLRTLAG